MSMKWKMSQKIKTHTKNDSLEHLNGAGSMKSFGFEFELNEMI